MDDATHGSEPSAEAGVPIPLRDVVEAFLGQAREGVFVTDDEDRILLINAVAEDMFGYDRRELLGRPVQTLFPAGIPRPALEPQGADGERRWRDAELNLLGRHKDESDLPVHVSVTYPDGPSQFSAAVFIRPAAAGEVPPAPAATAGPPGDGPPAPPPQPADPPSQTMSPNELDDAGEVSEPAPLQDQLTGLPGHVLFMDRLSVAMARSGRKSSQVAVLLLDVDRLRLVNDSYGKGIGDRLLVAVAERLFGALRPGDTVARVDDDEFAILCDEIAKREGAATIAERVHDAVSAPFGFEGEEVTVSFSVGYAVGSGQDHSPESLFRKAQDALVRSKDRGPGQVVDADEVTPAEVAAPAGEEPHPAEPRAEGPPAPGSPLERPVEVAAVAPDPPPKARAAGAGAASPGTAAPLAEGPGPAPSEGSRLLAALQRGEFRLAYQPIVRLHSGRIAGVEALLRWQDPERGLMPPGEFMAEAEETGLIHHIGAWVLREACRESEQLQAAHPEGGHLMLTVNLSARQLAAPDFVNLVRGILAGSRLDPGTLYLEIGESSVMENTDSVAAVLADLRSTGVRISIDDFGTGFSSLAHLNRFPIDFLKIDRSFTGGLDRDVGAANVVTAVISMAHALGLPTIAEGVESDAQLYTLRRLGCDYAQGYLFARPQPLANTLQLLQSDPVW